MCLEFNSGSLFLDYFDLEEKDASCSLEKLCLRSENLESITNDRFADSSENIDEMASFIAYCTLGSTLEMVEIEEPDLPPCSSDISTPCVN